MPRESAFGKLLHHFHTHPKGRLHEFLFWSGLGLALGLAAVLGYRLGYVSLPFFLIMAIIAVCLVGWSLLPQKKAPPPKAYTGRLRAEVARNVEASKAERKRKPKR